MNTPLDLTRARKIAEATWGGPAAAEYRCNREGAWWFTTPQHGGLIVDAHVLSAEERDRIAPLAAAEQIGGTEVYIFEEDEGWAIAFDRLGIGRVKDMDRPEVAEEAKGILRRWEGRDGLDAPGF